MTGMIYFVGNDSEIKIGYSETVSERRPRAVMHGKTSYGFITAILGNKDCEQRIHNDFEKFRIPRAVTNGATEVFLRDGEVGQYVNWLCTQSCSSIELKQAALDRMYEYPNRFPWTYKSNGGLSDGAQLALPGTARTISDKTIREERRHNLLIQLSSESDDYITPPCYTQAAKLVMGGIDLDPASNPASNRFVGAANIFTIADDGLRHDWFGRVWLNPPYGGQQADFVLKAIEEYRSGRVKQVIFCLNAHALETEWFQKLVVLPADGLCITHHRPKFAGGASQKPPEEFCQQAGLSLCTLVPIETDLLRSSPRLDSLF